MTSTPTVATGSEILWTLGSLEGVLSIDGPLPSCGLPMCGFTLDVISSPGLEDGRKLSSLPAGPKPDPSGPAVARARHFLWQAKKSAGSAVQGTLGFGVGPDRVSSSSDAWSVGGRT